MPTVKIINDTSVPLHICLSQVSPLHYANSVPPKGGSATMRVGRVWFTIQARIDRGDNGYDKFQTYAPIAAVTIGALSLGAGAIYVAAAGGTAAAMASLSARIGASVAAATPTAKRLYKLAQRGQKVARVGQVVGIGGGAAATAASKSLEDHATSAGKSALKRLLQGSVLSSPGWLMDRDRTFRITGGPRASVVDGLLVIETDTTVPFELKDESGKTVAMGNQDGGDKVPKNEIVNDINDATEAIAKLSPSVKAAMVAATATGAAPALPTKKKDGLFMRMIKGDGMFL